MPVYRKKRPLERSEATRDATLVVIATEGEKTEKIYFDAFRSTRMKIRTIPSEEGRSAPNHVLANVEKFRAEYDLGDTDELWLVLDVDRWPPQNLSPVAEACASKKFNLAASNPCFELWLALHLNVTLPTKPRLQDLEKILVASLGSYNKNGFDAKSLLAGLPAAIAAAKALDLNKADRWPQSTGSHVYKIFDRLELRNVVTSS